METKHCGCEICAIQENDWNDRMDLDEYQSAALRSFKHGRQEMTLQDYKAMLAAIGMAGEVGECTEPIKKWFFRRDGPSSAEVANILEEELGDVMWYVALAADAFGLKLSDIAAYNINKLKARYPEKK